MESKQRLIDADELWQKTFICDEAADMRWFIDNATTVDAVPVVHGRWEVYQIPPIMCCSECDWATGVQSDFNYCPNCGAKMDGDVNG